MIGSENNEQQQTSLCFYNVLSASCFLYIIYILVTSFKNICTNCPSKPPPAKLKLVQWCRVEDTNRLLF